MAKTYEQIMAEYADPIKKQKEALAEAGKKQKAQKNAAYDQLVADAEADTATAKKETAESYEERYSQNAVQQMVNERYMQERMANLGLTDSGLNRTQMTAIQLQRGRADYETGEAKRAAVQSLEDQLTEYKRSVEQQKTDYALEVDNTVATQQAAVDQSYATLAQGQVDDYNAEVKSRITAIQTADPTVTYEDAYKQATEQADRLIYGYTPMSSYGGKVRNTIGTSAAGTDLKGENALKYIAQIAATGTEVDDSAYSKFIDDFKASGSNEASLYLDVTAYANNKPEKIVATTNKLVAAGVTHGWTELYDHYKHGNAAKYGSFDAYVKALYLKYLDYIVNGGMKPTVYETVSAGDAVFGGKIYDPTTGNSGNSSSSQTSY